MYGDRRQIAINKDSRASEQNDNRQKFINCFRRRGLMKSQATVLMYLHKLYNTIAVSKSQENKCSKKQLTQKSVNCVPPCT